MRYQDHNPWDLLLLYAALAMCLGIVLYLTVR